VLIKQPENQLEWYSLLWWNTRGCNRQTDTKP